MIADLLYHYKLAIPPDEVLYRLSWKEICRLLDALTGDKEPTTAEKKVQTVKSLADM